MTGMFEIMTGISEIRTRIPEIMTGIIQIMIGWYIFKKNELKLYRMLIILVWISFILNKKCLVNEVIKKNGGFIYPNFDDLYIIIGIPILFILSYIKLNF